MIEEIKKNYTHFWRIYERVVPEFSPEAWRNSGFGLTKPARLGLHLILSIKYYIKDKYPLVFPSGKIFEDYHDFTEEELPSIEELLALMKPVREKADAWVESLDLSASNPEFPWAGKTKGGLSLFLLRHSLYHLGELNALLNHSMEGAAPDYFVETNG